jgi:hypothetical protein
LANSLLKFVVALGGAGSNTEPVLFEPKSRSGFAGSRFQWMQLDLGAI